MNNEKEIEKLKLIIAGNMAAYSKAQLPYEDALQACAVGILASGIGDKKQAVKEYKDKETQILAEAFIKYNVKIAMMEEIGNSLDGLFTELYGGNNE